MLDTPITIERIRELLRENAPYVYQQVTLHKPLETEQIKFEVKTQEKKTMTPDEQGAAEFQQYLDDDWAKRNQPITPAGRTQEVGIKNSLETNIPGAIPTL